MAKRRQPSNSMGVNGDRQRDHQANERTFLAWLRTAIALIGFGVTIARFGIWLWEMQPASVSGTAGSIASSQTIGLMLVISGLIMITFAVWHYNRVFWQIERGNYQPSQMIVWVTAGVVLVLGILSIPLMLWRPPRTPPSSPSFDWQRTLHSRPSFPARDYFSPLLAKMRHHLPQR